jgi:hypothetical protein
MEKSSCLYINSLGLGKVILRVLKLCLGFFIILGKGILASVLESIIDFLNLYIVLYITL